MAELARLYDAAHAPAYDAAAPSRKTRMRARDELLVRLDRRFAWLTSWVPLLGTLIALALAAYGCGPGTLELSLLFVMYSASTIGLEVGYHRLFTHRAFQAKPALRVALAILGSMSFQGPVIWWVATHRRHHALSDRHGDPHSPLPDAPGWWPRLRGLYRAHTAWTFDAERTRPPGWSEYAKDLYRDQAIFRVHYHYLWCAALGLVVPAIVAGAITRSAPGALMGLLWGGLVRIFLADHAIRALNSVSHAFGSRSFDTRDESRNNWWLVIPTFGQGWHHNHHAFPRAASMARAWWQLDPGAWVIFAMARCGWASKLRSPDPQTVAARRSHELPSGRL